MHDRTVPMRERRGADDQGGRLLLLAADGVLLIRAFALRWRGRCI